MLVLLFDFIIIVIFQLKNNSFAISDEEMQADIGTGVYLRQAKLCCHKVMINSSNVIA